MAQSTSDSTSLEVLEEGNEGDELGNPEGKS